MEAALCLQVTPPDMMILSEMELGDESDALKRL